MYSEPTSLLLTPGRHSPMSGRCQVWSMSQSGTKGLCMVSGAAWIMELFMPCVELFIYSVLHVKIPVNIHPKKFVKMSVIMFD